MSYIKMSPEYIKFDYESSLEELVDPGKIESIELLDGKNSYTPGDKITVKLSFDQAVSLIGNKNLILKIGDSKIILNPISEGNAREFKFEGTLPTTLSEGTFNLVLECNNDIEILNTVGKNTTLNGDIELGNSITINKVIDKSDLVKVIENAKNIIENETDKYTESSIDALKEAIAIAEETIANEVATQEQVDSSYNVLLRAYLSLRLTPDKSLLEGLIKEVSSIDLSKYTAKSAEIVEKALEDANKVLNNEEATEKEVNKALENLKNAKNSLVASSDSNSNTNSNQNSNSDSNANSNSANLSRNNKDSGGSSTGNSTTGKLPQTGTTGVVGTLISGVVTLLCGLGLSRKNNN